MRILLVNPFSIKNKERKIHSFPKFFHYALGVLGRAVEDVADIDILDCEVDGVVSLKCFKKYVEKYKPDIVGFSAFTIQIEDAHLLAECVKNIDKDIWTLIGGPHATILPLETSKNFPFFDIVVKGDGVDTLREIIESKSGKKKLEDIKGIVFKKNGEIFSTPSREWKNLNYMPFPKVELFKNINKYTGYLPYEGKREFPTYHALGCPYRCIFCFKQYGEMVRFRRPERTIEEIKYYIDKFSINSIYFFDWVFGLTETTDILLEKMIEEGISSKISFKVTTRVDIPLKRIEKMREAGCEFINFGVESGSQRILNQIKKGININQVREAVRCAKSNSMKVELDFIIGNLGETIEDIKKTEDLIFELEPDFVNISFLTPFPNTELWERVKNLKGIKWTSFGLKTGEIINLSLIDTKKLWLIGAKLYAKFYFRPSRIKNLFLIVNFKTLISYAFFLLKKILSRLGKFRIKQ